MAHAFKECLDAAHLQEALIVARVQVGGKVEALERVLLYEKVLQELHLHLAAQVDMLVGVLVELATVLSHPAAVVLVQ